MAEQGAPASKASEDEFVEVARIAIYPHGPARSRVEIAAPSDGYALVRPLLPEAGGREFSEVFEAVSAGSRTVWDLNSHMGLRVMQDASIAFDLDLGLRIGARLLSFSEFSGLARPVFRLLLWGGPGIRVDRDQLRFLAQLNLTLERQTVAQMVPGRPIATDGRLAVDLGAVMGFGAGDSLEGQIGFRYGDIGGVYLGAGYQWFDPEGATFSIGLFLGTLPAAAGMAALGYVLSR